MHRSDHTHLHLIAILFAMSGTPAFAEPLASPQASPTSQPAIRDVKVRPRNELTDSGSSTPHAGTSPPDTDVKHIRTTRERNTDEPGPAVQPLRPPAAQQ